MTDGYEEEIVVLAVLFCRISGCLLFAPGVSSPRIPVNVRLFLALAVTTALSPLLMNEASLAISSFPDAQRLLLIPSEIITGSLIGLVARFFVLSLQFAVTTISNFIGMAGIPGIPLEEAETGSPLTTLVTTAAVTAIFVAGLDVELLKALIDSYAVMPIGSFATPGVVASTLVGGLNETWLLALRLSGPFLLYGVIVNFALGLANRFAQQISVYQTTTGLVMLGGLLLLSLVWFDWMALFIENYRSWLVNGGF